MRNSTVAILIGFIILVYTLTPIGLIAVSGSSMEPTISDGSLQLYLQSQDVSKGDIIIFESSQREGEYIIHRVVGSTSEGFITKGDNNERTDQQTGEDPVSLDQIRGVAIVVNEYPLHIPYIGTIVTLTSTFMAETLVLSGAVLLVWSFSTSSIKKKHNLSILTHEDIVNPLFIMVFLILTGSILFGGTSVPVSIIHSETDISGKPYVITLGSETIVKTIYIENPINFGQTTVYSEKPVTDITRSGSTLEIDVVIQKREHTGAETLHIKLYNHPPIIPLSILQSLTNISPLLSALASSASMIIPTYIAYRIVGSPRQQIQKPRNHHLKRLYDRFVDD